MYEQDFVSIFRREESWDPDKYVYTPQFWFPRPDYSSQPVQYYQSIRAYYDTCVYNIM